MVLSVVMFGGYASESSRIRGVLGRWPRPAGNHADAVAVAGSLFDAAEGRNP